MREHVGAVGDLEAEADVLLDQHHAGATGVGERAHAGSSRSTITGASPRLSSSSSSSRGFWISAQAIASICCSPPLSRPARRADQRSQRREVVERLVEVGAARPHADAEVLADREAEEDPAPLGDVRDPGARPRGRGHAGEIGPAERDRPRP